MDKNIDMRIDESHPDHIYVNSPHCIGKEITQERLDMYKHAIDGKESSFSSLFECFHATSDFCVVRKVPIDNKFLREKSIYYECCCSTYKVQ